MNHSCSCCYSCDSIPNQDQTCTSIAESLERVSFQSFLPSYYDDRIECPCFPYRWRSFCLSKVSHLFKKLQVRVIFTSWGGDSGWLLWRYSKRLSNYSWCTSTLLQSFSDMSQLWCLRKRSSHSFISIVWKCVFDRVSDLTIDRRWMPFIGTAWTLTVCVYHHLRNVSLSLLRRDSRIHIHKLKDYWN